MYFCTIFDAGSDVQIEIEINPNLEKHANKRLQQKCPIFRDPEIYDIFLLLNYFWSYKQIFLTPSLLITLYVHMQNLELKYFQYIFIITPCFILTDSSDTV